MDWKSLAITDGTGQRDRRPVALDVDYFNADELAFEQLLAMAAGISSKISYYNLGNKVDGDWGEMFRADEAVIMATILAVDSNRLESDFFILLSTDPEKIPGFLFALVDKFDLWYRRLSASQHQSGELLGRELATIISKKLAPELERLRRIIDRSEWPQGEVDSGRRSKIWDSGKHGNSVPSVGNANDSEQRRRQLSASFHIFSNAISHLQTSAAVSLQQSLGSGQHDPAIGLFMAFLKQYEKAQRRLNRFTQGHLDFYYQRILKVGKAEALAQSFFLLFETQPGHETARVEKGTEFSAGKDSALNEIIYLADEALSLSDTRIESLATLYLQHDNLIAPETELGYVTRMKSGRPGLSRAESGQNAESSWPLFGAEQAVGESSVTGDARIGFCIASELLLLQQGQRKVDIAIEFEAVDGVDLDTQLSGLLLSDSKQKFEQRFGPLFAHYLLRFDGGLSQQQKNEISSLANSLLPSHQSKEIGDLLSVDWQELFYKKLFKKVFSLKLTSESGWLDIDEYLLLPLEEEARGAKTGFRIRFVLGVEATAITVCDNEVHGEQLPAGLPLLHCLINPQSSFFPYSVFSDLVVAALQIDVEVSEVKNLQAYNQHGQLDPAKPFQPFGPAPGGNAYFVIGNHELAGKQLHELKIDLDWAELPAGGGFEAHYSGYDRAYANDTFVGDFSALVDSRWLPEKPARRTCFPLFETEPEGNAPTSARVIEICDLEYAKPIDSSLTESEYAYNLNTRNGFYRISLTAPASAFGHGEYTQLLTRVLSENARRKKNPLPIPNPPYTPTLNGISIAYKASARIEPSLKQAANSKPAASLIHLHPFGVETAFPKIIDQPCYLMPRYTKEGNLFIGLSGNHVAGPLNLLFHLSQDQAQPSITHRQTFHWYYLASNSWEKMKPAQLLGDSTHGFLAPGIVSLNIPADITRGNSVMPGDYYWLRVSVDQAATTFSGCYSIRPHALRISRKTAANDSIDDAPPDPQWTSLLPLPGIGAIKQAFVASTGRPAEKREQQKIRIAERLHHKNRALLPSDYELLVLERFPNIYKVKCFNSISSEADAIKPGQVLIVVVANSGVMQGEGCLPAMVDARQLEQIRTFVKRHCSAFASIEVRNPLYELVQVRCTVKFVDALSKGVDISRLNQQVSDYICPWKTVGYEARFGWSISQQDIESYIRSLDYVEFVTNFSLLHITRDREQNYSLFDTAPEPGHAVEPSHVAVIQPRYPWSLAMPMDKHFIETIDVAEPEKAKKTGVNELSVGRTFIVSGRS